MTKFGYQNVVETDFATDQTVLLKAHSSTGRELALKLVKLNPGYPIPRYDVGYLQYNLITCYEIHDFIYLGQNHRIFELEWANRGDLRTFTKKSKLKIKEILLDLIHGLDYLHQKGVIHGDLKPSNVLIFESDGNFTYKVSDYNNYFEGHLEEKCNKNWILTPEYSAPEQFDERTVVTDIWSLGCMLYEMCSGRLPFGSRTEGDSIETILKRKNNYVFDTTWSKIKEPYRFIIYNCLQRNPAARYKNTVKIIKDLNRINGLKRLIIFRKYLVGWFEKKILFNG